MHDKSSLTIGRQHGLFEFQEEPNAPPSLMALYPLMAALMPLSMSAMARMTSIAMFGHAVTVGVRDEYSMTAAELRRAGQITDSRLARLTEVLDELQTCKLQRGLLCEFDMPAGQQFSSDTWIASYDLTGRYVQGASSRRGSRTTVTFRLGRPVLDWAARLDHVIFIDLVAAGQLRQRAELVLYLLALAVARHGETGHNELQVWLDFLNAPPWVREKPHQFMTRFIRKPLQTIEKLTGMAFEVVTDRRGVEGGFNLLVRPSKTSIEHRAQKYLRDKQKPSHAALIERYAEKYSVPRSTTINLLTRFGFERVSLAEADLAAGIQRAAEPDGTPIRHLSKWSRETLTRVVQAAAPGPALAPANAPTASLPTNAAAGRRAPAIESLLGDAQSPPADPRARSWFRVLDNARQREIIEQALVVLRGRGGAEARAVESLSVDLFDYRLDAVAQIRARVAIFRHIQEHEQVLTAGQGFERASADGAPLERDERAV